ncbi:homocysteine S-methyltransferase family protein, partial [candidate division CSSED10-310 bacterium]
MALSKNNDADSSGSVVFFACNYQSALHPGQKLTPEQAFRSNKDYPDAVRECYRAYLNAGCSVLLTNSNYPLTSHRLSDHDWEQYAAASVARAFEVSAGKVALWGIIRSPGPLLLPQVAQIQTRLNLYRQAVKLFLSLHCHGIFLDGFRDIVDARCALNACGHEKVPAVSINFDVVNVDPEQQIPEMNVSTLGPALDPFQPRFILLNSPGTPAEILPYYRDFASTTHSPHGLAVNGGSPAWSHDEKLAEELTLIGFHVLGGAEGMTPFYLESVIKRFKDHHPPPP